MDDLHRLLGEAVEVLALVGLLEALGERDERRVVQRPGRHGHEQLVRLADVAAVGPALEHAVRLGDVVGVERRAPVDLQLREDGVELGRVGVRRLDHDGPLLLVLEVGVQQAHRRGDAGVRRDDDPGDGQLACDVRAVERPAAAERDEAEVARVEALLHAVDADRVDHVLGQDLRDAQRRARDVEPERLPEGCDRGAGAVDVELEIAREARAAAHAAEHRLRVGRGGLGAPAAVADRPRVGARALRPDPQQAARVDAGQRAAAGADRVEVDHRDHHLVAAEVRVVEVLHAHDGVRRDADVRRGPAHVERDDAAVAGRARGGDAAHDPRDRPGHEQLRRARHRAVDRQRAAVGGHEVEVRVRRHVAQRRVHVAQVAAGLRADVRVERGRREPLVLAVLRDDLVADREVDAGQLLLEDLLDAPLVLGVEEREQEADGDRLDLRLAQRARRPRAPRPRRAAPRRRPAGRRARRRRGGCAARPASARATGGPGRSRTSSAAGGDRCR